MTLIDMFNIRFQAFAPHIGEMRLWGRYTTYYTRFSETSILHGVINWKTVIFISVNVYCSRLHYNNQTHRPIYRPILFSMARQPLGGLGRLIFSRLHDHSL
jgi:hypothetical protein